MRIRFAPSGVFRNNRRLTPMVAFQTLLGLSSTHQPTTYVQITGEIAAWLHLERTGLTGLNWSS
jgi:hypothetical protein